jgi:hypothetical protein
MLDLFRSRPSESSQAAYFLASLDRVRALVDLRNSSLLKRSLGRRAIALASHARFGGFESHREHHLTVPCWNW